MARRIIVFRQANLTGWRAVFAVFIAVLVLYLTIIALFAILSFIAFTIAMVLIGVGIYRLISGVWPLRFK
jgi:uncharacterized membrane protein HdeD (DUF308 family)